MWHWKSDYREDNKDNSNDSKWYHPQNVWPASTLFQQGKHQTWWGEVRLAVVAREVSSGFFGKGNLLYSHSQKSFPICLSNTLYPTHIFPFLQKLSIWPSNIARRKVNKQTDIPFTESCLQWQWPTLLRVKFCLVSQPEPTITTDHTKIGQQTRLTFTFVLLSSRVLDSLIWVCHK